MDKFKFDSYQPDQPEWFKRLVKSGKVFLNTELDPSYEYEDDWYFYTIDVAYLWTPEGIAIAYEGDTIVNHGTYCEPEQDDL